MRVHPSGFYAWLKEPESARAKANKVLLGLIRASYAASGGIYGSRRIHCDLMEMGEICGENRVARLMQVNGIKAIRGYKKPRYKIGHPAQLSPNHLVRQFTVDAPDQVWVTDITYIRTHEGWLYLAVVLDLFSRQVIGWSMKESLARGLVIDALLMACWRRQPRKEVMIHSDQGSQYGSDDWHRFLRDHNLKPSMSRRGNCWDNAVAESFFSSLKKERIRKTIYRTRDDARSDVFDYIEVFYNRSRRHSHLGHVSPVDYEKAFYGR
jgi:putative transposase